MLSEVCHLPPSQAPPFHLVPSPISPLGFLFIAPVIRANTTFHKDVSTTVTHRCPRMVTLREALGHTHGSGNFFTVELLWKQD